MLAGGTLQVVNLTVIDNTFNGQKAQFLYDLISRYGLKGFTFINLAS
jgi:hypothetical protein